MWKKGHVMSVRPANVLKVPFHCPCAGTLMFAMSFSVAKLRVEPVSDKQIQFVCL